LLGALIVLVLVSASVAMRHNNNPPVSLSNEHFSYNYISMLLTLTSPAFENGGSISPEYTCDGENKIPPLQIGGVPEGTEAIVLLIDDSDIPVEIKLQRGIEKFDHLILYNITPETTSIDDVRRAGIEGLNSAGNVGYTGPCPPTQYEPSTHRYLFKLYALSETLSFAEVPTGVQIEASMTNKILAETVLMGTYSRVVQ